MKITVRWHDGYRETFADIIDWRAGIATLWLKHESGRSEWIPLISVRHFDFDEEAGQ